MSAKINIAIVERSLNKWGTSVQCIAALTPLAANRVATVSLFLFAIIVIDWEWVDELVR